MSKQDSRIGSKSSSKKSAFSKSSVKSKGIKSTVKLTSIGNTDKPSLLGAKKSKDKSKKKKNTKCLLNPDGGFKMSWDHFQMLLILYVATLTPFKFSFIEDGEFPFWEYIDYVIDFFFTVDIFITLVTPIRVNNELQTSHCKIFLQYAKTTLFFDVISILPLDLIFGQAAGGAGGVTKLAKFAKAPRIYKMMKITKLLRTLRLSKKKDTFFAKCIKYFSRSDLLMISIVPIYIGSMIVAQIFCCVWHLIANTSTDPNNWLLVNDYKEQPTHDRFWASLYYVYATFTTTGYGDILPNTQIEYLITIFMMILGVLFYSFLYTTIINKFEKQNAKNNFFMEKLDELEKIKKKGLLKKTSLYPMMIQNINDHRILGTDNQTMPDFTCIRHKLRLELLLEICKREHGFGKMDFFKSLPKHLWIEFLERMEKRIYLEGDTIYDVGSIATHFYVIKKGKVWLTMNNEKFKDYPFVETNSYFGELELFDESTRKWAVVAKNKVIIYSIPKNDFLKLFTELDIRVDFFKSIVERHKKFESFERECGRQLRRQLRVKEKFAREVNATKNMIKSQIEKMKGNDQDGDWKDHLEEENDKYLENKRNEQRDKWTKQALKKLEKQQSRLNQKKRGNLKKSSFAVKPIDKSKNKSLNKDSEGSHINLDTEGSQRGLLSSVRGAKKKLTGVTKAAASTNRRKNKKKNSGGKKNSGKPKFISPESLMENDKEWQLDLKSTQAKKEKEYPIYDT